MKVTRAYRVAAAVAVLAVPGVAAHGTDVVATVSRQVEVELSVVVEATLHSGRPLAGAQVTVHAPGESEAPWLTGTSDDEGRFEFAPPAELAGLWEVRVAHRGHGGRVSVEVPAAGGEADPAVVRAEASSSSHLTVLQRVVMGGCVVWGLLGTALFFSRRRG